MKCKHITQRSYQKQAFLYCRKDKKQITYDNCRKCLKIEYRQYKPIKKKSNKLSKLEKQRFSILTNDLKHCFACRFFKEKEINKDDLHEIYQGKNRQVCMKNGFVAPLCRECHESDDIKLWLKKICEQVYLKNHTKEDFRKLVENDYLN